MPGRTADLVPKQCALADVIQEAPHLMTLLQHKSRKALSGCNQQLRAMMHKCVTAIAVHDQSALAQIVKGDWPQLVVIVLCKQHVWELRWPRNGNIQLTARFELGKNDAFCTACLVSMVKTQQQPSVYAVVTAFLLCLSSKCADVDHCAIKQSHGTVAMPDLSLSEWRNLRSLMLTKNQLGRATIGCLLRGCSVSLRWLDLNDNDLRSAGIELLVAAHLPNLGSLNLANTELDATALQHLVTGNWPGLKSLSLDGNQLDDMAVECLHSGDWPELSKLCLSDNTFRALGVHHLTCGRWPMLDYLSIDYAAMGATVLALLSIRSDALPLVGEHTPVHVPRQLLDHTPDQSLLWRKLKVVCCWPSLHDHVTQLCVHTCGK